MAFLTISHFALALTADFSSHIRLLASNVAQQCFEVNAKVSMLTCSSSEPFVVLQQKKSPAVQTSKSITAAGETLMFSGPNNMEINPDAKEPFGAYVVDEHFSSD